MASVEDKFWSGFNPGNMSEAHRSRLMGDVYGGIKTRSVSVRGRRGKYGYGKSTTKEVPFYDYYNGRGWDEVGKHIGIKNVNSTDEVRRLYDYMHGYKPPAPAAPAPKAAPKPAPKPISNPYKAQADQLMKTIKQMETNQTQKIAEIQEAAKARITYATPQAVQPANLTIAAAGSQPKQTGSSTFKRRSMQSPSTSNLRTINSMNI